ncbi:hypothetical protein NPIL_191881 [Nephila pilipes]|uniref:Uncharacterized protein n=1 Tax=Nephila pilipes TaxID=299642 RepID=A0A8X6MMS2_NEPPI|nr:hypothetical protein NPIL_191881 [Nephila pilipes]
MMTGVNIIAQVTDYNSAKVGVSGDDKEMISLEWQQWDRVPHHTRLLLQSCHLLVSFSCHDILEEMMTTFCNSRLVPFTLRWIPFAFESFVTTLSLGFYSASARAMKPYNFLEADESAGEGFFVPGRIWKRVPKAGVFFIIIF